MINSLVDQLMRDEGCVLHVYDDATGNPISKGSVVVGFPTIGIGRLIDKRKGGGITAEESAYLLANDVKKVMAQVRHELPWFDQLDDARKGVLLNMAFQMGVTGLLGFKNTLEMVRKGDYDGAARGMLNSKWAKQTPNRAHRLSRQMATGEWH